MGGHQTSAHRCLPVLPYYDWEADAEVRVDLSTPGARGPRVVFPVGDKEPQVQGEAWHEHSRSCQGVRLQTITAGHRPLCWLIADARGNHGGGIRK